MYVVSRIDRVPNEEVGRRAGIKRELASGADQRVLRWFGHVERMDGYRMARRELVDGGVSERRARGKIGKMRKIRKIFVQMKLNWF